MGEEHLQLGHGLMSAYRTEAERPDYSEPPSPPEPKPWITRRRVAKVTIAVVSESLMALMAAAGSHDTQSPWWQSFLLLNVVVIGLAAGIWAAIVLLETSG